MEKIKVYGFEHSDVNLKLTSTTLPADYKFNDAEELTSLPKGRWFQKLTIAKKQALVILQEQAKHLRETIAAVKAVNKDTV